MPLQHESGSGSSFSARATGASEVVASAVGKERYDRRDDMKRRHVTGIKTY